jgi:magnesium transporter
MRKKTRLIKKQRIQRSGSFPGDISQNSLSDSNNKTCLIRLFEFNADSYSENQINDLKGVKEAYERNTIKWLDIVGLENIKLIEEIGKIFQIHPLTLEDIVNTDQRAKFEDYVSYTLTVVRKIRYSDSFIGGEQVSILLLRDFVITFQESGSNDCFEPVRERIRKGTGRVRKMGADYLAYVLLDTIVDTYFILLDSVSESIDGIEDRLITGEISKTLFNDIHHHKREIIILRKYILPLRELLILMQRTEHPLIAQTTHLYLRDVHDHVTRIIEIIEFLRELLTDLTEIYLSTNANKMNEIMKVLTIVSSLFIPLTFIVGVYGMNFEYMPELKYRIAYPIIWIVMLLTVAFMLWYFRKRKWI